MLPLPPNTSVAASSLTPQPLVRNTNPLVTKETLSLCLSYLSTADIPKAATMSKPWRERINVLAPSIALGTLQEKLIKKGYLTQKVVIPKNADELTALSLVADSVYNKVYEKRPKLIKGPDELHTDFELRILTEMMEGFSKKLQCSKFPCFERFAALVHSRASELHYPDDFHNIKYARTPIIKKAIAVGDMELATRIAENVPDTRDGWDFKQSCYMRMACKYAKTGDFPKALELIKKIDAKFRDEHIWETQTKKYAVVEELIPLLVNNGNIREATELLKKCCDNVRGAGITALLSSDRTEEAFEVASVDTRNLFWDYEKILKYYEKKGQLDLFAALIKNTEWHQNSMLANEGILFEELHICNTVIMCYLFGEQFQKAFRLFEMIKLSFTINIQTQVYSVVFPKLSEMLTKRADLFDYLNKVPKGEVKDQMCVNIAKNLASKKDFDRAKQAALLIDNQSLRETTLKETANS